ncbi:MAG: ATP-dependent RNA helicase HrpA [Planctomycetota bacterium]
MSAQNQPEHSIALAMSEDQHNLRRMLRSVREAERSGRPNDRLRSRFEEQLCRSMERRQRRAAWQPRLDWDPELPVAARREEVAEVIRGHQVIVLCGETGSGKSTQLPKILTDMGRGIGGIIGHTQPRRIAARSVAVRVAEELGARLGQQVGFRIRFTDSSGPDTRIRLMTDGILLAETQGDPWLSQYDTIIVDEAHERSLNIDFLLGYLRRLLPRRRDLKLIITSATIDAARFAEHFSTGGQPAPVLHIAGRTWPVEIRWRPLDQDEHPTDETAEPRDWLDGVTDTVHEAAAIDSGHILVFLPTERDIREASKRLGGQRFPGDTPQYPTEIVPLFGRLSMEEQTRVFSAWPHRRIVLATNVAESSLTVPGIRFVIDTGTARISRYSARSRMQRLPIEPISQASARQRSGRCGRVGPGICFRLYSEDDFNQREAFTAPEIQRTNLAAVILRTLSLRLGRLDDFPFLDPPRTAAVREGYRTLEELGAIVMENARETTPEPVQASPDAAPTQPARRDPPPPKPGELTELGRRMARLPVDPRISRMILAAVEEHALPEVLAIAAFLETQDPRERPVDKQQAADEAHARFVNRDSDFLTILNLWDVWHEKQRSLSGSQVKKWCRQNFLSWMRMREWVDVHAQLRELLEDSDDPAVAKAAKSLSAHHRAGKQANATAAPAAPAPPSQNAAKSSARQQTKPPAKSPPSGKTAQPGTAPTPAEPRHNDFAATHRALLTGLLANIGCQTPEGEYQSAGGAKLALWPGSALASKGAKWFVAGELIETSRRFARTVARIQPEWIEPLADHLVTREYFEPHWDEESGNALIHEKVSLWGLPIVPRRRISLARIDPAKSRDLLIQHGLVEWGLLFGRLSEDGEDPDHGYEDEEEALTRGAWRVRPGRQTAPGRPAPRRGWGHEFPFLKHNREVLQQLKELQARTRSHHLLPGDEVLFEFYATRIPPECVDRDRLRRWYQRTHPRVPQLLQFDINQFADESQRQQHADLFPERLHVGSLTLPLTYQLDPGQEADGVTVSVPEEALGQLSESQLDWLVPGLLEQKVLATLRSLPKPLRRFFVPAPESARKAAAALEFGKGDFLANLAQKLTQLCGERIDPREFDRAAIPAHLQFNVRVLDSSGRPILEGRELRLIRTSLADRARSAALAADDRAAVHGPAPQEAQWMRTGFRAWEFDQLPEHISLVRAGIPIRSFLALRDDGDSVALTLCQTADEATLILRRGLRRLIQLLEKKRLLTQVGNLPNANTMRMQAATIKGIDFPQHLSLLMADRSFLHDAPLPRSRPAFDKTLELGRQRLGLIAQEFTQFLPGLFQQQLDTRRQLDQTRGAGWDALLADMQRQLQGLIHPTFLIDTPWPWLIQYPRYLTAIRQRLTRLTSGGLRNELAAAAELQPWLERFDQKAREHQQQRRLDPLLLHVRWMLEEFRVQLFAQKLGTAISISAAKLDEQFRRIS